MTSTHSIPAPLAITIALFSGIAIALQSRVNGALGQVLENPIQAALVSFVTGLILLLVMAVFKTNRAAMSRVLPVLKAKKFPYFYLLAGLSGAYFVVTQSLAAPILGIALYTVAVVLGQTLGGVAVDMAGFGPAGRKMPNLWRVIGAVLTVSAVIFTVSDRLFETNTFQLWPLLLPLLGGILNQVQQAMGGVQTMHYGSPYPSTVINFVVGVLALTAAWLITVVNGVPIAPLPTEWYLYLGGILGVFFVGMGAILVRYLGVLVAGMGMIAGQLLGSLLLDVFLPTPGTELSTITVVGTALTFVAVLIASIPSGAGSKAAKFRRRGLK